MNQGYNSYRQIMKTTSLFGGVQIFNIIISIVRSKFVAIFLGPSGFGIVALLNSTISMVSGLTNFGLGTSAIKDISRANETGNEVRISIVVITFRRLVWFTGILGAVAVLFFSGWLSQITFGDRKYTITFIWISITLLLNQISIGQGVILRGLRKISYLVKSGMIGSFLGLLITIPLYYFFGTNGIVPGIILTSILSLSVTWFFAHKIKIKSIYVSGLRTIAEGKGMLKMGLMISLSGLITLGASYIVRIFISNKGGVGEVGLYNAGFTIINTYVGMIFTAMGTDYYPRLAGAQNNDQCTQLINQQAEIALLILASVIMVFLVYIKWAVILLYSTKFLKVDEMIHWAALGMFFKAASWPIGFLFLAKGATKVFFWSELIANIYLLLFNIFGYKYFGLEGLGISFLVSYIIVLFQVYFIAKIKYNFSFSKSFYKILGLQMSLAISCFLLVKIVGGAYSYIFGSLIIVISAFFTYKELDSRLDMRSIIVALKNRLK